MAVSEHGRGAEQVSLRLPNGMRDRLKAVADANGRSANAEIIARLEESFEHADIAARIERLDMENKHLSIYLKLQLKNKKLSDQVNYSSQVLLHVFAVMIKAYAEGDPTALDKFVRSQEMDSLLKDFDMPDPLEEDDSEQAL